MFTQRYLVKILTFDSRSSEEFDARIRSALIDVLWTVSRLLTSNCLDVMPCFHVISPIFPVFLTGRWEEGLSRPVVWRSITPSPSYHPRSIWNKGPRANEGTGKKEKIERRKKVSVSTGGRSARKVHVAVNGDGFRPWKPIGSPLTRHSSIYHPLETILLPVIGILWKIVRDNVQIERSFTIW